MHLTRCPFEGQQITTHDTIKNIMYALVQKSGHFVWRGRAYALMLGVSLLTNLYMICEDQVFVIDMVIIN